MTIFEVVVVLGLMAILIAAGLNTVTLLDRSARRQSLHTAALELAQGRIEDLEAATYNPPLSPFATTNTSFLTNVVLALSKSGTNVSIGGSMQTIIAPVARGHLVTVTVSTTNGNQPLRVALQTVINEKAGNRP